MFTHILVPVIVFLQTQEKNFNVKRILVHNFLIIWSAYILLRYLGEYIESKNQNLINIFLVIDLLKINISTNVIPFI